MGGDLLPALHLETGLECGGPLLGCNAGGHPGTQVNPFAAEVWRELKADEDYTIVIDSAAGSGPVELDAVNVGAKCPTVEISNPFAGVAMTTLGFADNMTTSCGANWGANIEFYPQPDWLGLLTAVNAPATCSYELIADGPASIAVIEGSCAGRELACELTQPQLSDHRALIDVPSDGGVYTIAVSPTDATGATNFRIEALCALP